MTEDDLVASFVAAWRSEGFLSREHEEARLEAGRASLRRFREEQLRPGRSSRPTWSGSSASCSTGTGSAAGTTGWTSSRATGRRPRCRGRLDEPADDAAAADVVEPTMFTYPEHVVITDYKSSDVRDPAKARQRAKESLQLSIYAMGYEAMTGRLPGRRRAAASSRPGLVGTAPVDRKRIDKARESIRTAAAGIRARDFAAKPDQLACSWCAFREICPASAVR